MLGPLSMVWKLVTLPSLWSRIVGVVEINGDFDPSAVLAIHRFCCKGCSMLIPVPR